MSARADLSLHANDALPSPVGSSHPLRPISFGDPKVTIDRRADGTIYLRPDQPLPDYPVRLTDSLRYWATVAPDRLFLAEREAGGGWRKVTYAELLRLSRHIASSLLARGLSAESRSLSFPAIRSTTRWLRSAPCLRACRSVRCRRPIR